LSINLGEVKKKSDSNCLSPKGEFWNRLERALDVSKNVSEPAKNNLGNSPSKRNTVFHISNKVYLLILKLEKTNNL
jgi:hypothetical protein